MRKVIGVDPGLAGTGIGIVQGSAFNEVTAYSFGHIKTAKTLSTAIRLEQIYSNLLVVLQNEKPELMVIEDVFSLPKYPRSGITLGQVTGVIHLASCKSGVPVIEVTVREAKKVLSGNGNATKNQLERSVRHLLNHNEPIRPFHASDALALALIGLFRSY